MKQRNHENSIYVRTVVHVILGYILVSVIKYVKLMDV